MKSSIKIGSSFFQQEKRNYSNWRSALIREVLQNSVDSPGCTRIDLTVTDKENALSILDISDNGAGMSQEVLENIFLKLGETTKTDGSTTGGFGKARVLICFAQNKYSIRSHKYSCEGEGAEYEVTNVENFHRGCTFSIETERRDWAELVREILGKSSINPSVYLNGEKQINSLHRGRFARELSFANVYVNKSAKPGVHIRVNGTWMFSKYSDAKAQVCVEIKPEISRNVLTANRDGLSHEQENELQGFLNELAADTQSALKDRSRRFVKFINKSKGFLARVGKKLTEKKEVSVGEILPAARMVEKEILNPGGDFVVKNSDNISDFLGNLTGPRFNCPILDSLIIYADTQNEAIKKVIKFYDPTEGEIGSSRHKFIKQWKNICEIVAGELADLFQKEYLWAVGFCFDDDAIAMHQKTEGISYVMINPVDKTGKMKYSLNCKSDITKLTVSAIHEFCHVAGFQIHNQDFVTCYDGLLERVMPRLRDVFHAAADAKN